MEQVMTYEDRDAIREDRELQPDPELDLSGGRASGGQIAATAFAAALVVGLVIYGLNHQRDETAATGSEPAQATAQAPAPPSGQAQPGQEQNAQAPNAPQGETTGSGAATKPGAPQSGRGDSSQSGAPQSAPAKK
jgi:hypothetical protein